MRKQIKRRIRSIVDESLALSTVIEVAMFEPCHPPFFRLYIFIYLFIYGYNS